MKKLFNCIIGIFFVAASLAQQIAVDNTAAASREKGSFDWTVFIRADDATLNSIDHVEYLLNPTFKSPQVTAGNRANNFAYSGKGWGEFEIKTKILFRDKKMPPMYITYWLKLQSKIQQRKTS